MSRPDPAAAMNGVGTGHICDSCNRRIQHGDKAGIYVTWYDEGGWTPRRTWCMDCCPEEVDPGTDEADEAILLGVFFNHRLAGVKVRDRNRPKVER
jgi:hypothetical protein